jgi:hypothetical protein
VEAVARSAEKLEAAAAALKVELLLRAISAAERDDTMLSQSGAAASCTAVAWDDVDRVLSRTDPRVIAMFSKLFRAAAGASKIKEL